jgi:hypothetical protein
MFPPYGLWLDFHQLVIAHAGRTSYYWSVNVNSLNKITAIFGLYYLFFKILRGQDARPPGQQ